MNQTQTFWNRSEKALIIVSAIVVALGGLFVLWMFHLNQTPVVSIPTRAMPKQNAYDYFAKATRELREGPDQTLKDREANVKANTLALATLRQGFAYPYASPPERSFSTSFSLSAKLRAMARLLHSDSEAKAARGDWNGAVSSSIDGIQLGIMIPHQTPLIGSLVGNAIENIGRSRIWNLYQHLNAEQSRQAALRLETLANTRYPIADTLQQDKLTGQASLMEIFRKPNWQHQMAELDSYSESYTLFLRTQLFLFSKRRIFNDYTQYMNKAIAVARQSYAAAPKMPLVPKDPFCRDMVESLTDYRFKAINSQTQDALLMTTFALHGLHEANGAYPATLQALVPKYLTTIPSDPFAASGPIRYRRTKVGYVLYSVGPDGKDDRGAKLVSNGPPAPSQFIVWGPHEVKPNSAGDIVAGVDTY